jgi:hypothetical protein
MPITIQPQIIGQQADSTLSYCYVAEPLKIHLIEGTKAAIGTISVTSGTVAVTGVGTFFTQDLEEGTNVTIDGLVYIVITITDDTSLTVQNTFPTTLSGVQMLINPEPSANIVYGNLTIIDTATGATVDSFPKYIERDVPSLKGIVVDLMEVVKQFHDSDVYTFSEVEEVIIPKGLEAVVSKYVYKFDFYANNSPSVISVLKLPIIGGRRFNEFVAAVDHTQKLQELSTADLYQTKLGGYKITTIALREIAAAVGNNYIPIASTINVPVQGNNIPCGGVLHWKSTKGAWMHWGMDIVEELFDHSYSGEIATGLFESTGFSGGGSPYVGVNYTGVSSGFSLNLKALSLTAEQLIAVAKINGSPAIYYQKTPTSKLELMRLSSATAPIKTHINGGDFSVSLTAISRGEIKTK